MKSPTLFLAAIFAALLTTAGATGGNTTPAPGKFFVPLFEGQSTRLEGVLAARQFSFRLPEHVRYLPGSQFKLVFRSSPLLLPDVSTMTVSLNGRQLTSMRPVSGREKQPEKQTLAIDLDNDALQPGWNTLSVRCLLVTTATPCRDVDNPASWVELAGGTGFDVAFANQALFPELQRFPDAIGEPALMRLGAEKSEPAVSLLVADKGGDAAWRGVVVAAARLGQLLYLDDESVRVGSLKDFSAISGRSNGLIVAKREDLAAADLPVEFGLPLRGLKNGEGFLGEFITGEPARGQRRWIVVSGADDTGLEKAILALGSGPALRDAAANPWIVKEAPVVSPVTERLAGPVDGPVTFDSLAGGGIMLRGLFRNETSRAWPLPPGWQTAQGGKLTLDFSHAENLDKTSAFQVVVNDLSVGSIALTEANAQRTRRVLPIPAGMPGRDPSTVGIR
ncbi:MAG: cellulose biosynthesis cyclic di-GMP-binding regulatory protein BcsB, partial [Chthoniobacterales bacterium]|nr:cellulose biosynthesis cyclic di-GMP-binding regulatory protein BcsB [Chthoniobacterales bacterium]